jgi:hypothetical protein
MDERLGPEMQKKVYRSLVTLPRIFIAIQFLVIVILVAILVS